MFELARVIVFSMETKKIYHLILCGKFIRSLLLLKLIQLKEFS